MAGLSARYTERVTSPVEHRGAIGLLVLCGLCWSTGGILIKLVDWHPLAIWCVRSAIAGATLWAIRRPSLRALSASEWGAAFALTLTTGLFIVANKLTTAANAILIQYSAPIWVALLGRWFLGERARGIDWLTIVLVLVGITLFFVDRLSFEHTLGNLVALAAGVAFAFSTMTLRRAATVSTDGRAPDALRPLLLGNLIGAAVGLPFAILHPGPDLAGWSALVALGVVQQAAAYLCYAWAIRHATALEAMLIPVIEPIVSPLWVALAFGERPSGWAVVGGAIVVGAVVMRGWIGLRTRAQVAQ